MPSLHEIVCTMMTSYAGKILLVRLVQRSLLLVPLFISVTDCIFTQSSGVAELPRRVFEQRSNVSPGEFFPRFFPLHHWRMFPNVVQGQEKVQEKLLFQKKAIWIARVVGRDRCLSTVCPWKNRPHGRCRQNEILASEPSQEPPTSPGLQISQTSVKGTECGYKPSDLQEDNRRKMPRNTVLEMSIRFGSVLPAIISFCS